jgi:signal transduction histidine kinase
VLHNEPIWVTSHSKKLIRLLSNLITNALKFSAVNTEINIAVALKNGKAMISVADKGMGIREADKPFIFEAFTNARKKGTSGESSYGLGLSICKQIAEAYSGRIWFESEEGKGSTFYIELPLA